MIGHQTDSSNPRNSCNGLTVRGLDIQSLSPKAAARAAATVVKQGISVQLYKPDTTYIFTDLLLAYSRLTSLGRHLSIRPRQRLR